MSYIENVKHVIFDFDGVIIDSEHKKFSDLKQILVSYNYELSDELFRNFVGKKRGHFLEEISVSNIQDILSEVHKKDADTKNLKLLEGLIDFLVVLKNKNIQMHIATGSSRDFVEKLLHQYDIEMIFSIILTGDEIKESKPNPKIYLEMKRRLQNKNIIVIEDSLADVESAKESGLFTIGLGKDIDSDVAFETYAEIITYFNNIK